MSKGKVLFSVIGQLLKGLLKLVLLATYFGAKIIETIAGFLSKLIGNFLND